jgi:hypothetical protein
VRATTGPTFAIDQDFPDPDVLLVGDTYYAYSTNTPSRNVQVATSPDAKKWTVSAKDALPKHLTRSCRPSPRAAGSPGQGGQDVVTKPDGSPVLVFHSWGEGMVFRGMNVLPLNWAGDRPVVTLP